MQQYRNLHLWMIIPMLIMQIGIAYDYWGDFSDNRWSVHIHYFTGSVWYLFLIFQPYLASHGRLAAHRTLGIIGMFLAGAVCFTALSMMKQDIEFAEIASSDPAKFILFGPWFFYGIIVVEIVMILAFGLAVLMSIIKRKSLHDHAWWLISTVFIIMMPALSRGVAFVHVMLYKNDFPDIQIMKSLYVTQSIIFILLMLSAWKYKKLTHPATWLTIFVLLFTCFLEPLGRIDEIQSFLKAMIK